MNTKNNHYCHIEVTGEESDEELRELVWHNPYNGCYAIRICRCGSFRLHTEGDARTAKIVDVCDDCWKNKIGENN